MLLHISHVLCLRLTHVPSTNLKARDDCPSLRSVCSCPCPPSRTREKCAARVWQGAQLAHCVRPRACECESRSPFGRLIYLTSRVRSLDDLAFHVSSSVLTRSAANIRSTFLPQERLPSRRRSHRSGGPRLWTTWSLSPLTFLWTIQLPLPTLLSALLDREAQLARHGDLIAHALPKPGRRVQRSLA